MSYVAVATELMCSVYIVLCVCHHVHCESKTTSPTSCHCVSNIDRCLHVTADTAKRVLAVIVLSGVCLGSRPGTESSPDEVETPGFHSMIAYGS